MWITPLALQSSLLERFSQQYMNLLCSTSKNPMLNYEHRQGKYRVYRKFQRIILGPMMGYEDAFCNKSKITSQFFLVSLQRFCDTTYTHAHCFFSKMAPIHTRILAQKLQDSVHTHFKSVSVSVHACRCINGTSCISQCPCSNLQMYQWDQFYQCSCSCLQMYQWAQIYGSVGTKWVM